MRLHDLDVDVIVAPVVELAYLVHWKLVVVGPLGLEVDHRVVKVEAVGVT